jgi:hypothetical protein
MKYFFLLFLLVICGIAYLRSEQPKIWGDILAALKTPEDTSTSPVATASTNASPVAPAPINAADVPTWPVPTAPTNADASSQTNAASTDAVANVPKVFVPPDPLPAQPNWTWTVSYRDYHNVVVTKVEADKVHITYDGGIGTVNTSELPPELQKLFNYDPELAAQASKQKAAALAQAEAEEAPKIAALRQQ